MASVNITGLTSDPTASPRKVVFTTTATNGLSLTTVDPGTWGNSYSVRFQPRPNDYIRFTLALL